MDAPPLTAPPSASYHDRRTGLMIFGILEILLGCFAALMIPLSIFGQMMAAKQQGHEFDASVRVVTFLTFAIFAVGFIWLGIGSFQAKRWARALLLCLGWMGLCVGLVSLVTVISTLGSMDAMAQQSGQELPPAALAIGKFVAVMVVLIMYVLIPGALVLFYRSRHVKLTCEHFDPVERWTDRCPLPVIGMIILQLYGAVSLLLLPRYSAILPLAGYIVTGWTARIVWLGLAGFTLYSAWGFYRLNHRVWLLYTTLIAIGGLSMIVTFIRIGLLEYYRIVGLPEWQIKQVALNPMFQGNTFIYWMVLSFTVCLGYLFYLRRFFTATAPKLETSA